jgi:hypothetical protein
MKAHISRGNHKTENPVRDLLRSKINRSSTNGCLKN